MSTESGQHCDVVPIELRRRLAILRRAAGVTHPRLGDLGRPDAVRMDGVSRQTLTDTVTDDCIIHLTVTGRCNARCLGCINTALDLERTDRCLVASEFECDPKRDAAIIVQIAENCGDRPVTVALYGGEPLLELERISDLMNNLEKTSIGPRVRYMLYTNGQLLEEAMQSNSCQWDRIRLVSVSIDGDAAQHSRFRPGTDLPTIEKGLHALRRDFRGEVLFWSTLREEQSLLACFNQFLEYFDRSLVGHLFWHWAESPDAYRDFSSYLLRYGEELELVMDEYLARLRKGQLLSIIHLNELIVYLITGKSRGHSACAVEQAENYDVVGGKLTACADLPLSVGLVSVEDLLRGDSTRLAALVAYRGDLGCDVCGVFPYCGGRCPVQALSGAPERTVQICQLMRLHVGIVSERIQEIAGALNELGITADKLYHDSAYMTRYTDVVP